MKQCPNCKQYVEDNASFCSHCGYDFATPPYNATNTDNAFDVSGPEGKSRGIAALLAILFGGLGIQYFYLGKNTAGVISILLSLVTCGFWSIIPVIQGILMLCMTNQQFRTKYVTNPSTFPVF